MRKVLSFILSLIISTQAFGQNAFINQTACYLSGSVTACFKPVNVASGGTGATTLTSNGVLIGNGTSAITAVTGTTSQVLIGGSGPSFGNVPAASLPTATATTKGAITTFVPTIASAVKTISSAGYTILDNDGFDVFLVTTGVSNQTVTLPAPANNTGRTLKIKKVDSAGGKINIQPNASETIDGLSTLPIALQYQEVQLSCDGTNWYIIAHPTPFYYEVNDDGASSSGSQTEAPFFSTTVPYAAIYRISCNFVVISGTAVGSVGQGTISIKTGSATYASATYRVTSSEAQVSTAVLSDRGFGFLVAEWTGPLAAGDSVHMGVSATSVVNGVLHNQHFMTINEIRRN